jgi:hypothetical protein
MKAWTRVWLVSQRPSRDAIAPKRWSVAVSLTLAGRSRSRHDVLGSPRASFPAPACVSDAFTRVILIIEIGRFEKGRGPGPYTKEGQVG